jgi:hypothetical protein
MEEVELDMVRNKEQDQGEEKRNKFPKSRSFSSDHRLLKATTLF